MNNGRRKAPTPKGTHNSPGTEFQHGNRLSNKYKAEYCQSIVQYFKDCKGFPTFDGYALSIGVRRETLTNWGRRYRTFNKAFEIAKCIQYDRLINGALLRRYDPKFAKFIAINCFGMKERNEINDTMQVRIICSNEKE